MELEKSFAEMIDDYMDDLKVPEYERFDMDGHRKRLDELQRLSDKYGYKLYDSQNGEVIIVTECESWKFKPKANGKIKLMHKVYKTGKYHLQFERKMSFKGLFIYMSEHEKAKYHGWVDFTYTKDGRRRA